MALLKELELYLSKYGEVVKEKKISDFGIQRKFRYDYFLPKLQTAIEINGGSYIGGRHNFGEGYERDLMKFNLTMAIGLRLFQFTYSMLLRQEYKLFL